MKGEVAIVHRSWMRRQPCRMRREPPSGRLPYHAAMPFPVRTMLFVGNTGSLTPPVVIPNRQPLEVR